MKLKPRFTKWKTSFERYAEYFGIEGSFADKEEAVKKRKRITPEGKTIGGKDDDAFHIPDSLWHHIGRPYYKVWPSMMDALANTKLDIPVESFYEPYSSFVVMLPRPIPTLGKTIQFFVIRREFMPEIGMETADGNGEEMEFLMQLNGVHPKKGLTCCMASGVRGKTMQYGVDQINKLPLGKGDDDAGGVESRQIAFSIAIAVAFFGTDNHEVVMPDLERTIIDKGFRPKLRKLKQEEADRRHAREIVKCKGWLVGSEIDLPRPEVINRGESALGSGAELTAGHVRSGHLRMQPCGKDNKDRKLIFVPPTVVRPDLPFRQSHGYRIRGDE